MTSSPRPWARLGQTSQRRHRSSRRRRWRGARGGGESFTLPPSILPKHLCMSYPMVTPWGARRGHQEKRGWYPKAPEEGGPPASRQWPQGSSDLKPGYTVTFSWPQLPKDHPVRGSCPPRPAVSLHPPQHPSQFEPLIAFLLGGRPRAALQRLGGTGLGLWGWSAGRILEQQGGREEATLGPGLGQPLRGERRAAGNEG